MMERLLSFLILHRQWLAWPVVVLSVGALISVSQLTFDDQPRELFHRENEDMKELEQFFQDFGPDDNELILVIDGQRLFQPDTIAAIWKLHARLRRLEFVSSSRSIADVRKRGSRILPLLPRYEVSQDDCDNTLREALRNPIVVGQFLSRDATTMLFLLELKNDIIAMTEVEKCVTDVQQIAKSILEPVGLRIRLAGHPAIRVDLINNTREERMRFAWISGAVSAGLAWVLFRSFSSMVVCVGGPAIGVLWTMGILSATNGRLNVLGAAVPALIFIIGFTDSIHLMYGFRRLRSQGHSTIDAVSGVIKEVGLACALTSITTCIAFASFSFAELDVIRDFGLSCALGVLCTLVSVIITVPIYLASSLGQAIAREPGGTVDSPSRWNFLMEKWTSFIHKFSFWIVSLGMGACVVCGALVTRLVPDIRWSESLPDKSDTRIVIEHCDKVFGGTLPIHIVVEWPEGINFESRDVFRVATDIHQLLRQESFTSEPFSYRNVLAGIPRSSNWKRDFNRLPSKDRARIVREDLRKLLVTARIPDIGASVLEPKLHRLERQLRELEKKHVGFQLSMTGTSVLASRNVRYMIQDLTRSLWITGVLVSVILVIAFKSVLFGALSLLPNILPLLITTGLLQVLGYPLQIAAVLTLSVCLGIAVDDTIHLLTRYRLEVNRCGDQKQAISTTFRTVGRAMLGTTVILVVGFLVASTSQLPPLRVFALLSSFTLIMALLADFTVLPAQIFLMERIRKRFVSHRLGPENPDESQQ